MKRFIAASCTILLILSLTGCVAGPGKTTAGNAQGIDKNKASNIQSTQQQNLKDTNEVIGQLKETADVLNSLDDVTQDDLTIPNP